MKKLKKRYYVAGILILIVSGLLFSLSTITKNYLVKNSEKLIGRKITLGEMHFNYLRIAVTLRDFILFEGNKTDHFASFRELYINFNPWALLSGEYSFAEIRLAQPYINIIQDNENFNFDTLIPESDSTEVKDTTLKKELKFSIRNIQLTDGQLKYNDIQNKDEIVMNNLNLELPLIAWNNEQSNMGLNFKIGEKGQVSCKAMVNNLKQEYQVTLGVQNLDIKPFTNYLTGYFDVSALNGLLTADMNITGDLNESLNIVIGGKGSIADFSMLDGRSEKIVSSPEVSAVINEINLKTYHFGFEKIEVEKPELQVIREKEMTNIERFLLPYFKADTLTEDSVSAFGEPQVTYHLDTIRVNDGLVTVSDRTLSRPFQYVLDDLNLTMAGLTESADRIPVDFRTKLNHEGELSGSVVWSMAEMMNLEVAAKLKRMNLVSFSPITEYYIASPVTQGLFNYDLTLKMTPVTLENQNRVKVADLEFGKRTKDTTAIKAPVRLVLYLMKDVNDEIKIDLPVSGNPSDPKFRLGKVIWKTFVNLMVKIAASPFRALANLAGSNPEAFEKLPFSFAQDSLGMAQRDLLTRLATIIKKKPELMLTFTQTTDPGQEKNKLAIQLVKSEYLARQAISPDSIGFAAAGLRDDDAGLLAYIRTSVPEIDSIGIEKACIRAVEPDKINTRFLSILEERNRQVSDFLVHEQGLPGESVLVQTIDLVNLPQELRIPQFKIEVSLK